jgi:hypothetical protein
MNLNFETCIAGIVRQGSEPNTWGKTKQLACQFGLSLLLVAGSTGCVGYVGPDYGPAYVGPYWGPDFYVFGGGYHGHYAHAYAARGAASRGFAGHGRR